MGLRLDDLERLDYGTVLDILTESANDGADYDLLPSQEDFDRF